MNQALEHWKSFASEFHRDGSLRDIYVFDAQIADWDNVARFIVDQGYRIEFSGGWTQSEFPADISSLFPTGSESHLTTLSVDVSGIRINCHFFSHDEIEFDLDPAQVVNPSKLGSIFEFMRGVAEAVGKDVVLTPENMREIVIFRCRPGVHPIEHTPFGGFA